MDVKDLQCEQVVILTTVTQEPVRVISFNPDAGRVTVVTQPRLGYIDGEVVTVDAGDLSTTGLPVRFGPWRVHDVKELREMLDACAAYIAGLDGDSRFGWLMYLQHKVYGELPATAPAPEA